MSSEGKDVEQGVRGYGRGGCSHRAWSWLFFPRRIDGLLYIDSD